MFNKDKHIVAIDLGSSKIALTVATVDGDDVQIVYYKETPSAGIRNSCVYNGSHAAVSIEKAITEAENELGIKITQAVTGMPKFPVRVEINTGKIEDRGADTDITIEDIEALKSFAQDSYPLSDPEKEAVYGAVAQSF